jgi:hypothetical protein
VIDLGALNPGTQIVFIVAMYIGVYPVAISMRNSNVYQVKHFCINLRLHTYNTLTLSELSFNFRNEL